MVIARHLGDGEWGVIPNVYGVSFWGYEKTGVTVPHISNVLCGIKFYTLKSFK